MGTVRVLSETAEAPSEGETPGVDMENLEALFSKLALDRGLTPPPPVERVVVKRAMPDREILTAMAGLGAVLAVRLMLLLAAIGAFALAYMAMAAPTWMALAVLGTYAVTIVGPLVWLSTVRT